MDEWIYTYLVHQALRPENLIVLGQDRIDTVPFQFQVHRVCL